jgi:hypothetical protein
MCDGTLPGCSPHKVDPTIIPKVQFQLSRKFHFMSHTGAMAKATIAYGMALSPALIEIAAVSLHKILETTTTTTSTQTEAGMLWFNGDGELCFWKPAEECVSAFKFEDEVFWGCTKSGSISNSGWCSQDTEYTGRWKPCEQDCTKHHPGFSAANAQQDMPADIPANEADLATCFFTKAPECVPKFTYQGLTYSSCVQNPHDKTKAWCSDDVVFANRWHRCGMECPQMATTPFITTPKATLPPPQQSTVSLTPVPTIAPTPEPTPAAQTTSQTVHVATTSKHKDIEATPTSTTELHDTRSWHCAHDTGEDFCKSNPSLGDMEYKWFPASSPCHCSCCQRSRFVRLLKSETEESGESDKFVVHFHPDALIYKVDEDLIQALIDRDVFRGLTDGREEQLGEVRITGFKILHPESTSSSLQVYSLPSVCVLAVIGALLVSAVIFRLKRVRNDYAQLDSEASTVA